jgi:hypothetical protein
VFDVDKIYCLYFQIDFSKWKGVSSLRNGLSIFFHKKVKSLLYKEFQSGKRPLASQKVSDLVISITSHGDRVSNSFLSIYSILRQTKFAAQVILWLDEKTWNYSNIPESLNSLIPLGLEIRFVEDLGPSTKFFYAFSEFSESSILTLDDDVIYPKNLIETFWNMSKMFPKKILCAGAREIQSSENKGGYWSWPMVWSNSDYESENLLPLGVMGIWYPSSFVKKLDLVWIKNLIPLCPTTDDLLIKKLGGYYRTGMVRSGKWSRAFIGTNPSPSANDLMHINLKLGLNDINWKKLDQYFI